ncbi:MAG: hypothetical protein ACTSPS_03205 [Promethearchaeota archaeon]
MLFDLGFLNYESKPPEKFYFLKIKALKELLEVYDKIVKMMSP